MKIRLNNIRRYLSDVSRATSKIGHKANIESFVLKHGRSFKSQPTPDKFVRFRGASGECYRNAAAATIASDSLVYVEGFALAVIPVLHAWCVTTDGKVVELTWDDGVGSQYYGIPFSKKFLQRQLWRTKTYGLIDRWELGFELIRGKFRKRDWIYKNLP